MPLQRKSASEYLHFKKQCKYIGSVAVNLLHGEERQRFVNEKLLEMKNAGKGIPVVFLVTDEGVKILKPDESAVKMAQGITRIAFSTCLPDRKLFAYVAKSVTPEGVVITQSHMFKTKKNHYAQELSSCISRAFKIAYSRSTTKRKNRVNLFEQEAEDRKTKVQVQKKRWARDEMAHGHEHSGHALRAKNMSANVGISPDVEKLMRDLDEVKISDNRKHITPNESVKEEHRKISHESDFDNCVHSRNTSSTSMQNNSSKPLNGQQVSNNIPNRKYSKESEVAGIPLTMASDTEYAPPLPKKRSSQNSDTQSQHVSISSGVSSDLDVIRLSTDNTSSSFHHNFVKPASKFGTVMNEDELASVQDDVFVEDKPPAIDGDDELYQNFGPHVSIENMTMSADQLLKSSEWYQPGFSRDIAETVLQNRSVGSFFIRDSMSNPGSFVLTVKVPATVKSSEMSNYLIEKLPNGSLRIKGFASTFPNLIILVAHYGTVQEDIPCRLWLANDNPLHKNQHCVDELDCGKKENNSNAMIEEELYDSDECEDPDYQNFSSNFDIMRELSELS